MTIFQKSVIKRHLDNLDKEQVEEAYHKFRENYSPAKIEEIKKLKEEEYQDGFLRDIFVNVFGYILKPDSNYNLAREFKNQGDGKKADGAILKNEKAVAVIELKSTKTKDLKSITDQAFNYKYNQPECKYIITSNFQKLRFYIDYANEYEEFDLFNLQKEDFELLYLLLNANNIFSDLPLKLKEETKFHEQQVSDKLYKDYSVFKNKLFENLIKNNPDNDKLTLFNKSQKLLDRFLFILFAEDSGLLPPNSISRIIDTFSKLTELDAYKPIYDIYKQYFGYMNIGRKGKTNADDIPAYNGGLFYTDELLDNLIIDDKILIDDLLKLSEYDFNTEVDVNILGHIFEHSLSEIEEITAEIEGTAPDKTKSKRKKDGVFYTPKYITQYIVENTIGTLCNEKRKELEIEEIEFDGSYRAKDGKLLTKGKKLYQKLNDYKDWLLSLKIVDPACGSGAFLNQALNFLIEEHKNIDDIIAELTNTALRLFDTDKAILENNLYGVDINEESVEIAKLSLWLRTAQKGRKLSSLNDNIKCGNSLIDDPEIAGEKAFNWNTEFKEIMDNGGFDIVIGNPPYVSSKEENFTQSFKTFLTNKYNTAIYQIDLYILFLEKSIQLQNSSGMCSFIVPNAWLNNLFLRDVRKYFLKNSSFYEIVSMPHNTFASANVDTVIVSLGRRKKLSDTKLINCKNEDFIELGTVNQNQWLSNDNYTINLYVTNEISKILKKIKTNTISLSTFTEIARGVGVYHKRVGHTKELIAKDPFQSNTKEDDSFVPYLRGKNVKAWHINWNNDSYISYGKWLAEPREPKYFEGKRIVLRQIPSTRLIATYIQDKFIIDQSVFIARFIKSDRFEPKSVLALITSKLFSFYFRYYYSEFDDLFPKVKLQHFKDLPIHNSLNSETIILDKIANERLILSDNVYSIESKFLNYLQSKFSIESFTKKLHHWYELEFGEFVKELNKTIKKIGDTKLSKMDEMEWMEVFETKKTEVQSLKTEIYKTDKEIDQMVYELYGLTEEEIKIVEKN